MIHIVAAALTANGSGLLLGIHGRDNGRGAADWLERGADGQFPLRQTLTPAETTVPPLAFGLSVALDAAGMTALVGEIKDRVFLFTRGTDGVFAQRQVITSEGN